jgi:hypothetical protein
VSLPPVRLDEWSKYTGKRRKTELDAADWHDKALRDLDTWESLEPEVLPEPNPTPDPQTLSTPTPQRTPVPQPQPQGFSLESALADLEELERTRNEPTLTPSPEPAGIVPFDEDREAQGGALPRWDPQAALAELDSLEEQTNAPVQTPTPTRSPRPTSGPSTVELTAGYRAGRDVDRDENLRQVYRDALAAGHDEEGAKAAMAVALTEGGFGGAVGDRDRGKGSGGTFQLFFGQGNFTGMGNALARELGMNEDELLEQLSANPHAFNSWVLKGYLGQAIKAGQKLGLRGAALAEYAQRHGQRSESPERAAANYATATAVPVDVPEDVPQEEPGGEEYVRAEAFTRGVDAVVAGGRVQHGYHDPDYEAQLGEVHHGVDIASERGAPVTTPVSGRVVFAGSDDSGANGGLGVVVRTADGRDVSLWHLGEVRAQVGETVEAGTLVGSAGSTGNARYVHTHVQQKDAQGNYLDPTELFTGEVAQASLREPFTQEPGAPYPGALPVDYSAGAAAPLGRGREAEPAQQAPEPGGGIVGRALAGIRSAGEAVGSAIDQAVTPLLGPRRQTAQVRGPGLLGSRTVPVYSPDSARSPEMGETGIMPVLESLGGPQQVLFAVMRAMQSANPRQAFESYLQSAMPAERAPSYPGQLQEAPVPIQFEEVLRGLGMPDSWLRDVLGRIGDFTIDPINFTGMGVAAGTGKNLLRRTVAEGLATGVAGGVGSAALEAGAGAATQALGGTPEQVQTARGVGNLVGGLGGGIGANVRVGGRRSLSDLTEEGIIRAAPVVREAAEALTPGLSTTPINTGIVQRAREVLPVKQSPEGAGFVSQDGTLLDVDGPGRGMHNEAARAVYGEDVSRMEQRPAGMYLSDQLMAETGLMRWKLNLDPASKAGRFLSLTIARPMTRAQQETVLRALPPNTALYVEVVDPRNGQVLDIVRSEAGLGDDDGVRRLLGQANNLLNRAGLGLSVQPTEDVAPPFYSVLRKTLQERMGNRAPAQQVAGLLRNSPVKQDELEWTGFNTFLEEAQREGRVLTKQEVMDFLDANEVRIEEVSFPRSTEGTPEAERLEQATRTFNAASSNLTQRVADALMDYVEDAAVAAGREVSPDEVQRAERTAEEFVGNAVLRGGHSAIQQVADTLGISMEDAQIEVSQVSNLHGAVRAAQSDLNWMTDQAKPKWDAHGLVTPGGTNYRELILTLPAKQEPLQALKWEKGGAQALEEIGEDFLEVWSTTDESNGNLWSIALERDGTWWVFQNDYEAGSARSIIDAQKIVEERIGSDIVSGQRDSIGSTFRYDSHWQGIDNPLAHVRFNDRVDADGKKVLFLEEVQSDWHQKGREGGYKPGKEEQAQYAAQVRSLDTEMDELIEPFGREIRDVTDPEIRAQYYELLRKRTALKTMEDPRGLPPKAPFETLWPELALKRMIRYAAENGYDRVAWTPGSIHASATDPKASRYGTERIAWEKRVGADGTPTWAIRAEPQVGGHTQGVEDLGAEALARGLIQESATAFVKSKEELRQHIEGYQGMASGARERVENRTVVDRLWKRMQESEAGVMHPRAEGMAGFYDQSLVNVANKLAKKFGSKVTQTDIETGQAWADVSARKQTVHALDITPEMSGSVMNQGQPLFAVAPPAAGSLAGLEEDEEGGLGFEPNKAAFGIGAGMAVGSLRGSGRERRPPRVVQPPAGGLKGELTPQDRLARAARAAAGTPEQRASLDVERENRIGNLDPKKWVHPELRILIADAMDDMNLAAGQRRGKISDDETLRAAAEKALGMNVNEFLKTKPGKAFNAEDVVVIGMAIDKKGRELISAQKKWGALAENQRTQEMEEKLALQALEFNQLVAVRSGAAAEAGRALRAFRQVVVAPVGGASGMRPADKAKLITKALDEMGGGQKFGDWLKKMNRIDAEELAGTLTAEKAQRARFLMARKLSKPTVWDKIDTWRYSSMLSSWKTHMVNFTGNITESGARPMELLFSGYGRAAVADVRAMAGAIPEAFTLAVEAFKTGATTSSVQTGTKLENVRGRAFEEGIFGTGRRADRAVGRAIQAPLDMLAASDEFFKAINKVGALQSNAWRMANGDAAKMQKLLRDMPDELVERAHRDAARATFTNDPGQLVTGIQNLRTKGAGRALGYILPFVKTPANIFQRGGAMTLRAIDPTFGAAEFAFRKKFKGESTDEARIAFGRNLIAKMAAGTLAYYASQGLITGEGPSDVGKRRSLEEAGWQPHSVKIGDRWIDYTNAGPIALPAALIANGFEAYAEGQKPGHDLANDVLRRMGGTVIDLSYMRGLADLIKGIESGGFTGAVGSWAQGVAGSFVPFSGMASAVERIVDPEVTARDNLAMAVGGRLPGVSEMIENEPSVYGRPQAPTREKDVAGLVTQILLPWRNRRERSEDPVATEVARLAKAGKSVGVQQFRNVHQGERQKPPQKRLLQEQSGKAAYAYLADTMSRPEYAALSDDQKAATLKSALQVAYKLSDLKLGDKIARDPHHRALMALASTPQFEGVKGTVDEIREKNYRIARAKAKLSEYRERYGPERGESRLFREDKAAYNLAQTRRLSSELLDAKRKRIDEQFGGALLQKEKKGLVGAGTTVLTGLEDEGE